MRAMACINIVLSPGCDGTSRFSTAPHLALPVPISTGAFFDADAILHTPIYAEKTIS